MWILYESSENSNWEYRSIFKGVPITHVVSAYVVTKEFFSAQNSSKWHLVCKKLQQIRKAALW